MVFSSRAQSGIHTPRNDIQRYAFSIDIRLCVFRPFAQSDLLGIFDAGFDEIAARRKVFKVETVGDCYVAVCGLVSGSGSTKS